MTKNPEPVPYARVLADWSQRRQEMLDCWKATRSFAAVAKQFNVSRQRARIVIQKELARGNAAAG